MSTLVFIIRQQVLFQTAEKKLYPSLFPRLKWTSRIKWTNESSIKFAEYKKSLKKSILYIPIIIVHTEQFAVNHDVVGSSPTGGAKRDKSEPFTYR